MRFLIKLRLKNIRNRSLPINYQYSVSAAIYKKIAKGNQQYSEWLHSHGYNDGGSKRFKLFNFSNLIFPLQGYTRVEDRLVLLQDFASIYISFLPEQATLEFIKGLFSEEDFEIFDNKSGVIFSVYEIESVKLPKFEKEMSFHAISPITISIKSEEGKIQYIKPDDPNLCNYIINNLIHKYEFYYQRKYNEDISNSEFQILNTSKEKLITIKTGMKDETKVKAYSYDFKIKTSVELLKIMYETGIGEKGSLGFGMVEVKNESKYINN